MREGRPLWRLIHPLVYDSDRVGLITVPCGAVTDLASVPRVLFAYLLAGDTAHHAAAVHDYLYQTRQKTRSRQTADRVLYEAMGVEQPALGVTAEPRWRKSLIWAMVRLFGGRAWATGPARFGEFGNAACSPPPESEETGPIRLPPPPSMPRPGAGVPPG